MFAMHCVCVFELVELRGGGANVVVGYGILFIKILNTISYEKSMSSLKGIEFATYFC